MPRIAWLTDIHLNFLRGQQLDDFVERVAAHRPDAVLITGDIAEGRDLFEQLERMDEAWAVPIYFVLGNHDFYFDSIGSIRQRMVDFCESRPRLHYLSQCGPLELAPGVGLVGHDGWADARHGNYATSEIVMSDHVLIAELLSEDKFTRWPILKALGDEAAFHIRRILPEALADFEHVVLATHVPPFHEASWYEGRITDDAWAPHFTCKAMGDTIIDIMRDRPDRRLTVLCGHSHTRIESRPLPNVTLHVGFAEYRHPGVERVFEF